MLFYSKKALLLPSIWLGAEYLGTHLKEELTNYFESYQGISYSYTRQSRKECEHFANS